MYHKYLLYLFLLSSLPLNAMDDQKDASEITIHEAVYFDSKQQLQKLLNDGVNIDEKSKEIQDYILALFPRAYKWQKDDSPLHIATKLERNNTLQVLLEHNASVDVKNYWGLTPFLSAIQETKVEYVKVFLACGAEIDQVSRVSLGRSTTPLHLAVRTALAYRNNPYLPKNLFKTLFNVKTLLKYNTHVNIETLHEETALENILKIDGIKEFYLDYKKSLKKTKKKKKVKRKKQKQRKLVVNKDKG